MSVTPCRVGDLSMHVQSHAQPDDKMSKLSMNASYSV